jgi:hypothetical protein
VKLSAERHGRHVISSLLRVVDLLDMLDAKIARNDWPPPWSANRHDQAVVQVSASPTRYW